MQQPFSAIQLFCLFETSVRAERTLVRTERTDVTRSCADNGCRKIEAVFCNSPHFLTSLYYLGSLKELFRETILLNTGFSLVLSLQSAQK